MADRALSVPCSMFIRADGDHCLSLLSFQAAILLRDFCILFLMLSLINVVTLSYF